MSKKLIKVMDTSFRDGFQSIFGAKVLVEDFIPALQSALNAGINHIETDGGARFKAPIFFFNENGYSRGDYFIIYEAFYFIILYFESPSKELS